MECLLYLQKYSTRGWVYRHGEGWIFAELTPDELTEFKSYGPGITIPRMKVRLPHGQVARTFRFGGSWLVCITRYPNQFAYCTMPQTHPLALTRFRMHQVIDEVVDEKPLVQLPPGVRRHRRVEPGNYEAWLWSDEIKFCQELGCEITIQSNWYWFDWGVPADWGAPVEWDGDKEQSSIYGLMDSLTQEVGYVGKAINPQQRYFDHLGDQQNPEKAAWIQSLQIQGRNPELIILEEKVVGSKEIYKRERYWIDYYWGQGHHLTNRACRDRPARDT